MSELCEAQETRGSKFICEFGRNSTVYCFVASGLLYSSIKGKKESRHKRYEACDDESRHYLFSRQAALQVFSAQASLTTVFGMGTGGPSLQSIPTPDILS